jgi:hypothetical protein
MSASTSTRSRVSNSHLPGYTSTRTLTTGDELARHDIFDPTGTYVGQVVYVTRRVKGTGTMYGWRPAQQTRVKLTDKVDAIRRLPRVADKATP